MAPLGEPTDGLHEAAQFFDLSFWLRHLSRPTGHAKAPLAPLGVTTIFTFCATRAEIDR